VVSAPTIIACSLPFVGKRLLHYLVPLLLQPFMVPSHKESNIIHFLILFITIFTLT
jgi:hypothetical protein